MTSRIAQIWQCRFFWMSLVQMDLRLRYKRSVLGIGWSLLNPIAMTAVFCFIFSHWMMTDWRSAAPYFLAGLAVWDFISTSVLQGCGTFHQNEAFIRQCPLPMEIYPLRTVLGSTIHFAITLAVVMSAIALLTPTGVRSITVLWSVLPAIPLVFVFTWALCVLAGFVTVFFEDTRHILEVLFRMMFFLTPIIWPESMIEGRGLDWVIDYNPVVLFFDLIRTPLLTGEPPPLYIYRNAALLTAGLAVAAMLVTKWLDRKLIFRL